VALLESVNMPLQVADLTQRRFDISDQAFFAPSSRRAPINSVHLAELFVGISLFDLFAHNFTLTSLPIPIQAKVLNTFLHLLDRLLLP